jgi:uncharacterized protein
VIIVSDTTAITSLLKIGRVTLLRDLFGDVFLPDAVRKELLKYHSEIPSFLQTSIVADQEAVSSLRQIIDQGEAEAIILAEEIDVDALLIDDKQGRQIAERRGIRCLGLAGTLLMAKQNGLVTNLGEILGALETKANFYLDPALKRSLLARANEAIK